MVYLKVAKPGPVHLNDMYAPPDYSSSTYLLLLHTNRHTRTYTQIHKRTHTRTDTHANTHTHKKAIVKGTQPKYLSFSQNPEKCSVLIHAIHHFFFHFNLSLSISITLSRSVFLWHTHNTHTLTRTHKQSVFFTTLPKTSRRVIQGKRCNPSKWPCRCGIWNSSWARGSSQIPLPWRRRCWVSRASRGC